MDFTTFSPAVVIATVITISLAPFVAVMVTSFTKIVVVLSLLRNALGLQQVPPNVVINGLAIVLSAYVMSPVILDTHAAVNAHLAGEPPPARIQADIEARAIARAERIAKRQASAPAQAGEAARPEGQAPADPPPASPAAADALRAEAEAQARAAAGDGTPSAQAQRSPLFANVDNGSGAADDAVADDPADAEEPGPVVITATGAPRAPTPADAPMDAERLMGIFQAAKEPLRGFLIHHSNDAERAFFLRSAQRLLPADRRDDLDVDDFIVVIPAFTVSELTTAFQIGFLIFLPFLIIDLVVANILLALGMMMLSPTTISLPFKLLLFVLVDGWAKLVHGLVLTYGADDVNEVLELTKEALYLVMLLSGPPIGAAALVGLVIAFLQAATQLQEQTFAYACKFMAIVLMLFVTAALIGGSLYNYTERIFRDFPGLTVRN